MVFGRGGVVAPIAHNFSVSPSPLETNWVLELIGTLLGFRDRAWQYDQMKVIPRILVQIGPT